MSSTNQRTREGETKRHIIMHLGSRPEQGLDALRYKGERGSSTITYKNGCPRMMTYVPRKELPFTVIRMPDPGDIVLCDFCNADHTKESKPGGLLLGSKGICPECVEKYKDDLEQDELEHPNAVKRPDPGETFADFIRRIR